MDTRTASATVEHRSKRTPQPRRHGRKIHPRLSYPDYPFTMRLRDGRTLVVEVPGRWMTVDRDGSPAFLIDAVRFLDRVQVLAMSVLDRAPSPAYIATLREALGLTQARFGERIGVDKMTVSRWERGTVRPGKAALKAIEKVRKESVRRGVTIPS